MTKLGAMGGPRNTLRIDRTFPLGQAKEAQEASQSAGVTGKLVVRIG